jgi:hypothetical protein
MHLYWVREYSRLLSIVIAIFCAAKVKTNMAEILFVVDFFIHVFLFKLLYEDISFAAGVVLT